MNQDQKVLLLWNITKYVLVFVSFSVLAAFATLGFLAIWSLL